NQWMRPGACHRTARCADSLALLRGHDESSGYLPLTTFFFPSFSSALRTCLNSSSEALSARGNLKFKPSSALTMVDPITTRANHLWSEGTTCHGAVAVEVCLTIS